MPKRTTDYRETLLHDLQDPLEAASYINAAQKDSPEMLLVALRDVAESRQMAKVAEIAGVSRESLYRMLNSSGNPTYRSFIGILEALGIDFDFKVIGQNPTTSEPVSITTTRRQLAYGRLRGKRRRQRSESTVSIGMADNAGGAFSSQVSIPKKGAAFSETLTGSSGRLNSVAISYGNSSRT